MRAVGIWGTGSYVPERVLTNADLEKFVETSDEWIVSRTGIHERRLVAPDQATSDLAVKAAERALQGAGLAPAAIDLIIVCTITPDSPCPATACLVQRQLEMPQAAAFDLAAACSGFPYGLAVGQQFIATGMYQHVLVIGAESLSRVTDYTDRNTCVLFGDGAGAAVLGPVKPGYGLLAYDLGADGTGADSLQVPGGGSRQPASLATLERNLHVIQMEGREVFRFAARAMVQSMEDLLAKAKLPQDQVDFLVPHQANIRIIESAMRRFELPAERVILNLERYGNMSSASIAVAFDELVRSQRLQEGSRIVMCGFGAGLTWGSCLVRWTEAREEG